MPIQNAIVGALGAVAGAAVGISSAAASKQSKQEMAATKARKALQDEMNMKLTQEQIKGQKLQNTNVRLKNRQLRAQIKGGVSNGEK